MRQVFKDFFKALRSAELDISVSESLDAMNAVQLVGLHNRTILKNALSVSLAKTVEDKKRFDACFEAFFSIDMLSNHPDSKNATLPDDTVGSELARALLENDREKLVYMMQKAARSVDITQIWFFTQKSIYINRILQQMGIGSVNAEIQRQEIINASSPGQGQGGALRQAKDYLREAVRDFVEKQLNLYGQAATTEIMEEYLKGLKLSNVEERDFVHMHEIVRKMAKRLSSLHARKRKIENRGVLDFRRTLRKNLAYDGLLVETYWKKKTVDRPSVMAICDVSRSVRAYSRFLLLFLYSLNEVITDIRSFVFINRLIEVTKLFEAYPVEQAIEKILKEIGFGMTDYGQVFLDIQKGYLEKIDKRTTVIILGDARNNDGNPQTHIMKQLYERCKRVIWLNPEPKTFWGTGDSETRYYTPYCSVMKECNTIKHLEHIVANLLRISS